MEQDGMLVIDFGMNVRYLYMKPDAARLFAVALVGHADAIEPPLKS